MLYEGVLRFCRQAKSGLNQEKQDIEACHTNLVRAQKIVLELSTSLRPEVAPELCEKLNALYVYIYRRLVDANTLHDTSAIDEAINLIEYDKQTWEMLMTQLAEEGGHTSTSPKGPEVAGAQQTAISSLSLNG